MAQTLVKVTLTSFYHALATAQSRDPRVKDNCTTAALQMVKIANESRRVADDDLDFYTHHCHLRLAMGGNEVKGGFCVLSGELLSLWNSERGRGNWMLSEATSLGADRLDYFDIEPLRKLYKRHHFTEVLREPNLLGKGPDVVWARLVQWSPGNVRLR